MPIIGYLLRGCSIPGISSLEAFELSEGNWQPLGVFRAHGKVSIAPFEAATIDLADLWG